MVDASAASSPLAQRVWGPLTVEIREGDISLMEADVLVNAANDAFWMGGGVAGALKRAGGAAIEEEAMAGGPKAPGEVVVTGAGRLKARHVVHAAVMGQDLRTGAALIATATRNTLAAAERLKAATLVFPAFGAGVGGFPMDECARLMLGAVKDFAPSARSLKRVAFALFGAEARSAFERTLAAL